MSEPKLISPMLDNFDMGGPISDHDGVRCCPAMRRNSDDKYIVKIISVPASQTKLEALLLTGAYPDRSSALAYFKEQANGIADEKKILDNLAQLEGFVSFEDCQIVPMDDATGYDVYLLSEYRTTLERLTARAPLTKLAAVNLGLDLCAGLAVCRRSGYMFVDLKPSNIYVVGDKEYRIGDLGFVRLNSLKYEALPDKYRSCYTAPEVEDAFAPLNDTMDIYSVGLILYQVFNGGALPFSGKQAPNERFAAPAYADEEMAQIILRACDPNPSERWQDPVQMGQAIVSYMQKNGVNDTPLAAPVEEPAAAQTAEPELAEAVSSVDSDAADIDVMIEETATIDIQTQEVPAVFDEEPAAEALNETEDDSAAAQDVLESEAQDLDTDSADEPEAPAEDTDTAPESQEDEYDNLSFLDDVDSEVLAEVGDNYDGVTDEVSEILGQVDALAALQVPDPVVAPEPIEIKIPDPIPIEEPEPETGDEEPTEAAADEAETSEDAEEAAEEETVEIPEEEMPYVPKKKRTGLVVCIVLLVILALAAGAYFFYTQYYLQPIHTLTLDGVEDKLQVQLTADLDESLLTVVCADSHGNKVSAPVVGGIAAFSGLTPDTAYTVSVEVDGFHELTGMTSKVYSTPVQTKIAQMRVITGSEDGSAILSFAVEGPDSDQWNVIYNAEGEAERVTAFPAHMVTLAGLSVGKEYTFRLEPVDDIYISGETEIKYVAQNLVCAENLRITACADGVLTANWDLPEGETVSEWSVRCYNEAGYDETITTSECTVTFQNVDDTVTNTVEVTAANMSVSQRAVVSANSITVSEFAVDSTDPDTLIVTWVSNRDIPAEGWTIRYSVNGINAAEPLTSSENTVQIPAVPNGSYVFTILDGAGNAVLGGPFTHTQAAAPAFAAYSVSQSNITVRLCKTPAAASWSYKDLKDEDYVNTFTVGEKISMVLALSGTPESTNEDVQITYAIYDENNNLVSFAHDTQSWQSMWYQSYCELDLPGVPAAAGTYNVILYFNGAEACSQKFAMTV
ncbi:MAG: protein kinase [Oscillospiraceae bacterium]|nr:protein kinase [Oscillospiraceae bacterium]